MHSYLFSILFTSDKMPCPLIISNARWIKYSNATKLVQRWNFVLWNDGNAKYCWFEFLNICGIFMTCVCLLACKTWNLVWICVLTIPWWGRSLDIHCDELNGDTGHDEWWHELLIDDWDIPAGCCHLACSHYCMETEESKNIGYWSHCQWRHRELTRYDRLLRLDRYSGAHGVLMTMLWPLTTCHHTASHPLSLADVTDHGVGQRTVSTVSTMLSLWPGPASHRDWAQWPLTTIPPCSGANTGLPPASHNQRYVHNSTLSINN